MQLVCALGVCLNVNAQCTFNGAMSIYDACNGGQGCTGGCDLTAYQLISGYTMCNGTAFNGNCFGASGSGGEQLQGVTITVPAGCTMMVTAEFKKRGASCPNSGMDNGDKLILNGTTYTGSSNTDMTQSVTQTGGSITIVQSANRSDEILTYTTSTSGVCPACTVLPVELISFNCFSENGSYNLAWATASEHNSKCFDVEYSKDAIQFYKAATVAAAGESDNLKRYQQSVPDTFRTNLIYFRLKQVDKDGRASYSPVVFIETDVASNFSLMPNPTDNGWVTISANHRTGRDSYVEIFDFTGRLLGTKDIEIPYTNMDLSAYGKGMYTLRINSNGKSVIQRVICN